MFQNAYINFQNCVDNILQQRTNMLNFDCVITLKGLHAG